MVRHSSRSAVSIFLAPSSVVHLESMGLSETRIFLFEKCTIPFVVTRSGVAPLDLV